MDSVELKITATERPPGTVGFMLDGGYSITDDDTGEIVGGIYNQGHSTTVAWRGRKFRVSHIDLLTALVKEIAPDDHDAYIESLMEGGRYAGT